MFRRKTDRGPDRHSGYFLTIILYYFFIYLHKPKLTFQTTTAERIRRKSSCACTDIKKKKKNS